MPLQLQLTAVFQKVPEGYVAFVEELPGANTQGGTLEEARANLVEAVFLVLEANRALTEKPWMVRTSFASPSAFRLEAPRPRSSSRVSWL